MNGGFREYNRQLTGPFKPGAHDEWMLWARDSVIMGMSYTEQDWKLPNTICSVHVSWDTIVAVIIRVTAS